jgi:Tol biopolymer transport system component
MNNFRVLAFVLFLIFLLAACSSQESPPAALSSPPVESTPPVRETAPPSAATGTPAGPGEFSLDALAALDPQDILLQKTYEPTFFRLETFYPYGRVPGFTLFADGSLVYIAEGATFEDQQLLHVQLEPEEAAGLVQEALDLGLADLQSHTEQCKDEQGGTQTCIMDAAYTILRGRLPSGELHEVTIYADFANDPQAFAKVSAFFDGYEHPGAEPFVPEAAAVFVSPLGGEPSGPLHEWTLDPAIPQRASAEQPWAIYLEGEDLAEFMAGLPRNLGDFPFDVAGNRYNVYLVPWLPGVDYRAELEADFPASVPGQSALGVFSACPIPLDEAFAGPPGALRLVYSAGGLWMWDEGQEPALLAEGEEIDQVRLTADGVTVVFTRQSEDGPGELWAVDADGANLRQLAGGPDITGRISPISFSDDEELLAFSHYVDDNNAELWVAHLDGSGATRLVGVEDLRAIFDDFPNPQGVIPFSVQWVPGTHRLTYDAYPTGDGIFIYVQDQASQVDADTGEQSVLFAPGEGGTISYSPDGNWMAIASLARLRLMEVGGTEPRLVEVPYFAVGFGEYYFYPEIVWAPDSSYILLALPESETYAQDGPVHVWQVPVEAAGGGPSEVAEFAGFAPSFRFSPDLSRLSYWKAPPGSNERELHLASVDGAEDVLYLASFVVDLVSWAPDSQHFVYTYGEGETTKSMLGNICGDPRHLADFHTFPLWLDGGRFLMLRDEAGSLELALGTLAGDITLLLTPEDYDSYAYAVLPD